MAEPLQLRTTATASGHVVVVSGDVDLATSPTVAEALVQFANGDVSVDLSGVTFIDASGVSALIAARRHIERRNGRLILERLSPAVSRLLNVPGLEIELDVRPVVTSPRDQA